jgi:hypothetical protein
MHSEYKSLISIWSLLMMKWFAWAIPNCTPINSYPLENRNSLLTWRGTNTLKYFHPPKTKEEIHEGEENTHTYTYNLILTKTPAIYSKLCHQKSMKWHPFSPLLWEVVGSIWRNISSQALQRTTSLPVTQAPQCLMEGSSSLAQEHLSGGFGWMKFTNALLPSSKVTWWRWLLSCFTFSTSPLIPHNRAGSRGACKGHTVSLLVGLLGGRAGWNNKSGHAPPGLFHTTPTK